MNHRCHSLREGVTKTVNAATLRFTEFLGREVSEGTIRGSEDPPGPTEQGRGSAGGSLLRVAVALAVSLRPPPPALRGAATAAWLHSSLSRGAPTSPTAGAPCLPVDPVPQPTAPGVISLRPPPPRTLLTTAPLVPFPVILRMSPSVLVGVSLKKSGFGDIKFLLHYVTLRNLGNLSGPQSSYLRNGDLNTPHFVQVRCGGSECIKVPSTINCR